MLITDVILELMLQFSAVVPRISQLIFICETLVIRMVEVEKEQYENCKNCLRDI